MNVYLASRYSRFPEMQIYATDLARLGHTVTSRWILGDHDLRSHGQSDADHLQAQWAQEDWEDLCAADVCIAFTEGPQDVPGRARGGRHCEWGAALALCKRCIAVGYRENVFYWLPQVEFYTTWEACLDVLGSRTTALLQSGGMPC